VSLNGLYIILFLESFACPLDFGEDFLALFLPDVRFRVEIAFCEVSGNGLDQFGDAGEAALAHDILGYVPEESLHQVHP